MVFRETEPSNRNHFRSRVGGFKTPALSFSCCTPTAPARTSSVPFAPSHPERDLSPHQVAFASFSWSLIFRCATGASVPLPLFGLVCWRADPEWSPPPPRVEGCAASLSLRVASLQSPLRRGVVRVGPTFGGHHPPPDETPLLLCSSDVACVVVKRVPSCIRFVRIIYHTHTSVRRSTTLLCSLPDETEEYYHPSPDDRVGSRTLPGFHPRLSVLGQV